MTESTLDATGPRASEFQVGSAITRSAALLRRHLLTFFIVSLLACSPILLFAGTHMSSSTRSETIKELLWILFNLAVLTVFDTFGKAVLFHASIQDMQGGGRVGLIESLNVSLRQFWPLIGLAFASFLTSLGFVFLVLPGLILSTIWFVALPACIVERFGPWTSLRRSLQLTKGHRWKILGLVLLLLIPTWGSSFAGWLLSTATSEFVGTVGEWLCTTIMTAITAAVVVITYYNLRVVDEGADIAGLAVVFD